jgi:hypothetical protein
MRLILWIAGLKVAVGMFGFLFGDIHSLPAGLGPPACWLYLANIIISSAVAAFLLLGSRGDPRPTYLGAIFLAVASTYSSAFFPLAALRLPVPVARAIDIFWHVNADAFLPTFTWYFVRDFPRGIQPIREAKVIRLAIPAAVASSLVLFVVNAVFIPYMAVWPDFLRVLGFLSKVGTGGYYWTVVFCLTVPALLVALSNTRFATPVERRRFTIFMAGLLIGSAPMAIYVLFVSLFPSLWHSIRNTLAYGILVVVLQVLVLSFPVTTAYSVLVHQVLEVKLIVRKALQYAFARHTILVVTALPFLLLGWYLYRFREQTLRDLISGYQVTVPIGILLAGMITLRSRERALAFIDKRFYREQYDAQQILVQLVEKSRNATNANTLASLLETEIDKALHLERVAVMIVDQDGRRLVAPQGKIRPVDISSSLIALTSGSPDPLDVDLENPRSPLRRLPEAERQWLADGAFRLLVPMTVSGGSLLGVIGLGEKKSELPFSDEDRRLLSSIAVSGALTLENRLMRISSARTAPPEAAGIKVPAGQPFLQTEEALASECESCHTLFPAGTPSCAACSSRVGPANVPYTLLGKFRFEKRVGKGGMGIVYRALDIDLNRTVAIKTLPQMTPEHCSRLRREARAMAAVVHPNLALIFGAETWKGIPMLVIEFMEGGTLADRLAVSKLPILESVDLGIVLADVLDRIHSVGILHRDIKPSNIGYTSSGSPKLLDFGLARIMRRAQGSADVAADGETDSRGGRIEDRSAQSSLTVTDAVVGTLPYLCPEALDNQAADDYFDLWSAAIVLFEAIAGRNPMRKKTPAATLDCIFRAEVPDIRDFVSDCPESLALFFRDALSLDRRRRPPTAKDLRIRLQRIRSSLIASNP